MLRQLLAAAQRSATLLLVVAVIGGFWSPAPAKAQCEPVLEPGPFLPSFSVGTNDQVFTSCVWDPDQTSSSNGYRLPRLVIGGLFVTASGNLVPHVAAWDGTQWQPLGNGFNSVVRALAVVNNELFAGGDFTELGISPGSPACLRIAKYNPTTNTWSQVAGGFNAEVRALVSHNGELHAGGSFTQSGATFVSRIARLNPVTGTFTALGTGVQGVNNTVFAMVSLGGRLHAGGAFTQAGGVTRNRVAWFNSSTATWNSMGSGCDGTVLAMTIFSNGTTLDVIAAGLFNSAGGLSTPSVARWGLDATSGSWATLGSGLPGLFEAYGVFNDFDQLYVSGRNNSALAYKWDRTSWTPVGPNPSAGQYAFTIRRFNDEIVIGGKFGFVGGGLTCNNVARLHNNAWFPFQSHLNGSIQRFFGGDTMYVGGNFEQSLASGDSCANLVAWNSSPSPNGAFSGIGAINGPVMAMAMSGTQFSVPDLYIGGIFSTAGTSATNCNNVARKGALIGPGGHAASWSPVGAGFTNSNPGLNAPVFAMTTYGFMGTGVLRRPVVHAGGMFTHSGGVLVNAVAKFDGTSWQPLGTTGVTSGNAFCWVNSFAELNGTLYVAGTFDAAGGLTARSVAAWNGTSWSALAAGGGNGLTFAGVKGVAEDLQTFEGSVVATGRFDHAGIVAVNNVARWDGSAWHNMSQGLLGIQEEGSALAIHQGDLYLATADFSVSPNVTRIRRWTGSQWQQVQATGDGYVSDLHSANGRLHVGGSFTRIGGMDYAYWNRINCVCPADLNGDLQITPADVATAVNTWFTGLTNATTEGDFDRNGNLAPADIAFFVNLWFAALPGGC